MKKLILTAVCLAAIAGVSATSYYVGWCGESRYTVSPKYFETEKEAREYYEELNTLICGSEGPYTVDGVYYITECKKP